MAISFSTGLKNHVLTAGSLAAALNDGYIKVYSGAIPDGADAALGAAVLLNTYSDNKAAAGAGNGLDFEAAAVSGQVTKLAAQVWRGAAVANGTAAFFRFVALADVGDSSITAVRIQGVVGGAGADMFIASTTFVSGTDYDVDFFAVAVPA